MIIHHLPDGDTVHKYNQCIVILFSGKRHVISTGPNNGGYREDLRAVFNQDANPGPGMACVLKDDTYEGHMNVVAKEDLGLPADKCTGLCTAASMEHASIKSLSFKDLTVTAIVTAGIEHNGGRAGDPATFYEENGSFCAVTDACESNDQPDQPAAPSPGTINILLHINACLDGGTLARTLVTVSEAKTAALQELMVRSHTSRGLATGSGTDGIISICNPDSPLSLTNAGKNSKLGELIGRTVKSAVKESLFLQSGLCGKKQRDILRIMGRFGIDGNSLWKKWEGSHKGNGNKAIFMDRLDRLRSRSDLVRTSFLMAHVLDLLSWDLISASEADEMISDILERKTAPSRNPERIAGERKDSFEKDDCLQDLLLLYEDWLLSVK